MYSSYTEIYPTWLCQQFAIENGPVEIVDFPSYKMVIFHSKLCGCLPEGNQPKIESWTKYNTLVNQGHCKQFLAVIKWLVGGLEHFSEG